MPCALDPLDGFLDLVDDGGLDALGGLVHQEELRARQEHPRDRELLLLAARQHAALAAEQRLELGEELEDLARVGRRGRCPRRARGRAGPRAGSPAPSGSGRSRGPAGT